MKAHQIIAEDDGLYLEGYTQVFQDLSELIYTYACDNAEAPWLLNLETPPNEHERHEWFQPDMTAQQAQVLKKRGGGG